LTPAERPAASELPVIPAKRYFTIGEVSELCAVKPHVLRYWEQEFAQLKPVKRRGNRRYYQHHEVLLVRRIRELLYEHGFTIAGARNRLMEPVAPRVAAPYTRHDDGSAAHFACEHPARAQEHPQDAWHRLKTSRADALLGYNCNSVGA